MPSFFEYVRKSLGLTPFEEATAGTFQRAISMDDDEFIIVSSYGRTGTSSLQAALNILGIKCYHARDAMAFDDYDVWVDVYASKQKMGLTGDSMFSYGLVDYKDWNMLFHDRGFYASSDNPSLLFYKELMGFYPKYKVIHCVRDAESWYQSSISSHFKIYMVLKRRWFWRNVIKSLYWTKWFEIYHRIFYCDIDKLEEKQLQMMRYNEWNKEVMRYVPKERLLLFDIKKGWKPLCEFLGIEKVPKQPFPHANERAVLMKVAKQATIIADVVDGVIILLISCIIWIIYKTYI